MLQQTSDNLKVWVPKTTYEVNDSYTVYDVMQMAAKDWGFVIDANDNNQYGSVYVKGITWNNVKLSELDNGPKSGWMYTVNGSHPDVGMSEKYVKDGDVIIVHYTDDYTKEESTGNGGSQETPGDHLQETPEDGQHEHSFGEYKILKVATVLQKGIKERVCACGEKETKEIAKLTPTATLSASKLSLKVKESTSKLKVTGMQKGDSVKTWKSSNTKIFTVSGKSNGTCKITAGSKTGEATLTITLASGLKKKVTVTVKKGIVETTKITGLSKKISIKKGKKVTLKPVIVPSNSQQKVTYVSSDKKVATVSSKGVITAKKAGKAKITVKSGKKEFTVTVTVTK